MPIEECTRASNFKPSTLFPDPTIEMLASPEFNRVWNCIKDWDINVPSAYEGYCGATGNHVRAILDVLPRSKPVSPSIEPVEVFVTPGELKVLKSLLEGNTNAQIAIDVGVTLGTVRTRVADLLGKFHCNNRTKLICRVFAGRFTIVEKKHGRKIGIVAIESLVGDL